MQKPKATQKHINLHKAAQNAIKHLKKLPPGVRRQIGSLKNSQLSYSSKDFHKKVALPHQKYNLSKWAGVGMNPVVKC